MASSKVSSCICIFIASIFSLVASQGAPGESSLFNTLVNSQPNAGAPSVLDPGASALGSLLSTNPIASATSGFAPVTGSNTAPPNPSFPTLGGIGGFGSGTPPMGALASPMAQPAPNPFKSMLPFLLFSGMDFSKIFPMLLFGQGGMGGAGGGMFSNPLAMYFMGNHLF